ncbi:glyoxalase/bleomycin resistance/extradiol dioxygenase family protein [Flagellimonas myxillae]|uniref:glyoxalase/bleomycin resistance/extradiol dioxygenase family protein n=1 Tax=Flagellimonas myxillae TaxID=2942214 RepID=UPI00201F8AD2|nr:glyoxalase/bleomycin resistance/extradiol dioxygenase family protein [Muricauda myxillae]MCL6266782.1 glyoxalase/bleomycin resistance/extradiol dioxygenase family protein [Muricauda myxillae]
MTQLLEITPVLPSQNIERDVAWYLKHLGFETLSKDEMYACLKRENLHLHLQWHADTEDDPLLGGSVIKIFVKNIQPIFEEFVQRGTVPDHKLRRNTPWNTHEFGFYDLNNNAIFFVEDV